MPTAFIMLSECYMKMHKVQSFWPLKIISVYKLSPSVQLFCPSKLYLLSEVKFLIFGRHADLQSQVLELRNASIEDACGILMLLLPSCV